MWSCSPVIGCCWDPNAIFDPLVLFGRYLSLVIWDDARFTKGGKGDALNSTEMYI